MAALPAGGVVVSAGGVVVSVGGAVVGSDAGGVESAGGMVESSWVLAQAANVNTLAASTANDRSRNLMFITGSLMRVGYRRAGARLRDPARRRQATVGPYRIIT